MIVVQTTEHFGMNAMNAMNAIGVPDVAGRLAVVLADAIGCGTGGQLLAPLLQIVVSYAVHDEPFVLFEVHPRCLYLLNATDIVRTR